MWSGSQLLLSHTDTLSDTGLPSYLIRYLDQVSLFQPCRVKLKQSNKREHIRLCAGLEMHATRCSASTDHARVNGNALVESTKGGKGIHDDESKEVRHRQRQGL